MQEMQEKIYAELPQSTGEHRYGGGIYTEAQLRLYADATHALRTQAQPVGDERAAFESSFTAIGRELGDPSDDCEFEKASDGGYCNGFMQIAWLVWQARAALAAPQQEVQEPVKLYPGCSRWGFKDDTARKEG